MYRIRALSALATSLLVLNGAFWLWPSGLLPDAPEIRDRTPQAPIVLELIEPTRQPPPTTPFPPTPPPPPPPTDLPPEEVPDEEVIEELDIPIRSVAPPVPQPVAQPNAPPAPPAPPSPPPSLPSTPTQGSDAIVDRPQRSPRIVRTSPPVCPDEVSRDKVTVRARVRVLVSQGGQVQEAEIVERTVTDRRDREEVVTTLPYGLDAAVLDAARRHLFRPARDNDQRVRSYTTITLQCSS